MKANLKMCAIAGAITLGLGFAAPAQLIRPDVGIQPYTDLVQDPAGLLYNASFSVGAVYWGGPRPASCFYVGNGCFITAAHVLVGDLGTDPVGPLSITMTRDLNIPGLNVAVDAYRIHPQYTTLLNGFDVAVLHTSDPLNGVPTLGLYDGPAVGRVTVWYSMGFGFWGVPGVDPTNYDGVMRGFENSITGFRYPSGQPQFWMSYMTGDLTLHGLGTHGFSGGPDLVYNDLLGQWQIAGLNSFITGSDWYSGQGSQDLGRFEAFWTKQYQLSLSQRLGCSSLLELQHFFCAECCGSTMACLFLLQEHHPQLPRRLGG